MDKELIINKIDVSKCWHRQGTTCIVSQHDFCDKHPNCYFKQLARAKDKIGYMKEYIKTVENARDDLEQEVEKWKHQAELGSDTTDRLSKELEDKNQEIEMLKNQNLM